MNRGADQLDWLAMRYALGELDAVEAASFEERLAEDEAAAGAVVTAVRLIEAVAHSQPAVASAGVLARREPADRSRATWNRLMVAGAACLALVALPFIPLRRPVALGEPADIIWRWQGIPLELVVGSGVQATVESPHAERLPPWLMTAMAIAAERGAQP